MQLLGITGGIATGKTTVTQMFAGMGAPVRSADDIAHELLAPGTELTRDVLAAFPACTDIQNLASATVDRRALSRLIFADPSARFRLERMTHPLIIAALTMQAAQWRTQMASCAALEIPLLFEAGLEGLADRVIVVSCRLEVQTARLRSRNGIGEAEAARQISAQWPLREKIERADFVITTDDGLEDTRRQVLKLWKDFCMPNMNRPI